MLVRRSIFEAAALEEPVERIRRDCAGTRGRVAADSSSRTCEVDIECDYLTKPRMCFVYRKARPRNRRMCIVFAPARAGSGKPASRLRRVYTRRTWRPLSSPAAHRNGARKPKVRDFASGIALPGAAKRGLAQFRIEAVQLEKSLLAIGQEIQDGWRWGWRKLRLAEHFVFQAEDVPGGKNGIQVGSNQGQRVRLHDTACVLLRPAFSSFCASWAAMVTQFPA